MSMTESEYRGKFDSAVSGTCYSQLDEHDRLSVRAMALSYRFTVQELRQVVEAARDLAMWGKPGIGAWWDRERGTRGAAKDRRQAKRAFFERLGLHMSGLRSQPTRYAAAGPVARPRRAVTSRATADKGWGMCPVASERTVCCNLRTIDAVQNCVFGCSYCAVQTFYQSDITIDTRIAEKLRGIPIAPDRFYHFGTGQASDSLAWGNREGMLDALCEFADRHPNVLLELKTKSKNITYFLENDVPPNVVCSWSLNTRTVIENEEHFTATLDERVDAARRVANRGVPVAFHFHPMVYYDGWVDDYPRVARRLMANFEPREVMFVSFGSVTLIKPVIRKVRELGNPTRILQMDMVPDPHGKLTYPDAVKQGMFKTMYDTFEPWHADVFLYLCMEKPEIWRSAFGWVYDSNEAFERDFGARTMSKLPIRAPAPEKRREGAGAPSRSGVPD